jgi:hypothetical protein
MKLFDRGKAIAARKWLAPQISRYAELRAVALDTKQRTASLTLLPKGEQAEITLTVERYEVHRSEKQSEVAIVEITCSREWLRLLAVDLLVGKRFPVPGIVGGLL